MRRISRYIWCLLVLGWTVAENATAQRGPQAEYFEEIVVSFEVPKLIRQDIFVFFDGNTVFVPMAEVFSLLDINVEVDFQNKRFSGFFLSKQNRYEIDLTSNRITVMGEDYPYLASELHLGDQDLYLRVDAFKKLFGLDMRFDFTMLRVYLPLSNDFPAYQKLKRKMDRERIKRQAEAAKDVVELDHERTYLSGGAADWMLSTNPIGGRNKHYYSLTTGGLVMGGDLEMTIAGNTDHYFDSDQFRYKWHYYFENPYVSQVEAGKIHGGGVLGRALTGALVTNRPQIRRKYFQTETVSGYVGEGWEVELYIDNKLTDYMMADERGFYNFNVDVYYGASNILLKMYGPNGEIRSEERIVRVPYNLLPEGEFEYTVSAGSGEVNQQKNTFTQANSFYGISDFLTVGASIDVPIGSDDENLKPVAALEATVQAMNNLTLNSSYAPNYTFKAQANYSKPSLINFNSAFTKYFENVYRNPLNQLYNVTFSASSPIKIGRNYLGVRYYVSFDKYQSMLAVNMNYGLSANISPFYMTYIGQYKNTSIAGRHITNLASELLVSTQLIRFIRPQFRIEYDHTNSQISSYGLYLAKRIFRQGQFSISYEHSQLFNANTLMISLNLLTGFADLTSRVLHNNSSTSMTQLQRGSIRFDRETKSLRFDRRNAVGYGSAVVRPFHDQNFNGRMDSGEEYIPGLRAKINGARRSLIGKERQYFYDGLRPYDDYLIQIDEYSLDNPLLKPTHENYRVKLNPNVVTSIKVPIVTASEIIGRVERQIGQASAGIGGIRIFLMNLSKERLVQLTSFSSGDFYYLGLVPGSYKAYIDPQQLERYGYSSDPPYVEFEVSPAEGGSIIENIDFLLLPETTDTVDSPQ